jgi:hypothetical protein
MLAKCANPSCSRPFRYLHEGKLFRLEPARPKGGSSSQRCEWLWLCNRCAMKVTLSVAGYEVVAVPLLHEPKTSPWAEESLCLRQAS